MRVYKSIRIDSNTKYLLDDLIIKFEEKLNKDAIKLISNAEKTISSLKEYEGYSVNVNINVTPGSIIDLAFAYALNKNASYDDLITEIYDAKDVKFLSEEKSYTPKLYFSDETLSGLDKIKTEIKKKYATKVKMNDVVKGVLYFYYYN